MCVYIYELVFRFAFAGVCLHVLEGHIGIVRCLELKRWRLVSGGDRKRIIVWNVKVNAGVNPGGGRGGTQGPSLPPSLHP